EPQYYAPIVPLCIMENMQIPATGWRVKIWARDYKDVLKNVRRMITGEIERAKKMNVWLRGNNCEVKTINNEEYMIGKYTYDSKKSIVTITELPISTYNNSYIKSVAMTKDGNLRAEFRDFDDYSNYDEETNV